MSNAEFNVRFVVYAVGMVYGVGLPMLGWGKLMERRELRRDRENVAYGIWYRADQAARAEAKEAALIRQSDAEHVAYLRAEQRRKGRKKCKGRKGQVGQL